MKTKSLIEMEQLLELKYRNKQLSYTKVLSQETRLRNQLKKMDEQAREADASSSHTIKALGADVIWKSWLERTKRSLNMELAQVLVQKEGLKSAVRKEYGKLLVGRELLENQKAAEVDEQRKKMLADVIDCHLKSEAKSHWS